MGPRFDETPRGRKFYESDIPKLVKTLEGIHAELKRANDMKEKEHELMYGYGLLDEVNNDESPEEG